MLPDGSYDVIVVDAASESDSAGAMHLQVAILGGTHKGEVVSVQATGLPVDELDALGTPGTLTVSEGEPVLVLEP